MLIKILTNRLKNAVNEIVTFGINKPYWIEITTKQPYCIYYFGPFDSCKEAQQMQHGYIEDLVAEQAIVISVEIKRCQPPELTIAEEEVLF